MDATTVLAVICSAVVFVGWLPRYNWDFGITSWCVLAGTAVVGWYAHPVVWLGLAPVVAVYYLALAPRHGPAFAEQPTKCGSAAGACPWAEM